MSDNNKNRNTKTAWVVIFTAVMLAFCLYMVWYVPAMSALEFQLQDVTASLETSRGRERKQQYEYDEVIEKLPKTRAELAETQPKADEAADRVAALKEERKALREEKERLETLAASQEAENAAKADNSGSDNILPTDADSDDKTPVSGIETEAMLP